jgi:F-type H+-transporting ATPase subunit b
MAMKIMRTITAAVTLLASSQLDLLVAQAAEGSSNATNPLTVDPDLAIFTAVIFLLLLVVLYVLAWKPLMAGLDQREQSIADMIEDAKRSAEDAARKLEQYEQQLASAAAEAQGMVAQARRDASQAGEKLIAEARSDAERQRQRALADIEAAKNTAVQQIADQSANMAFALARKLIQKELNPADHAALIREALEQFPSEN